jgi:uncharacterized protein involved in type VI secretion and phage assembly
MGISTYTQSDRPVAVTTPLGPDVLLLVGFSRREEISKPYHYLLDLVAVNSNAIAFERLMTTKTITVVVKGDKKKEANENFFVDLSDLSGYAVFLDSQGTGMIQNDD